MTTSARRGIVAIVIVVAAAYCCLRFYESCYQLDVVVVDYRSGTKVIKETRKKTIDWVPGEPVRTTVLTQSEFLALEPRVEIFKTFLRNKRIQEQVYVPRTD